jgi:hypothetical protein
MGSNLGTDLTGIDFVFLVVPVALVLAGWIFMVLRADTHPYVRHVGSERPQVTGGSRLPGTGFESESVLATGATDESTAGEGQAAESTAAARSAAAPADQQATREGRDSG